MTIGDQASDILDWLDGPGRRIADGSLLFTGICERVQAAGVPLDRAAIQLFDLHPLVFAYCLHWQPGAPGYELAHGHGLLGPNRRADTPFAMALEGGGSYRWRRGESDAGLPLIRELRDSGFTDYVSLIVTSSNALPPGVSWATRAPGGFADRQFALLSALTPRLGPTFETLAERRKLGTVMRTYVGRGPAQEVLAGRVQRGDVSRLDAVVLLTDLRGFSRMTATRAESEVLEALADYAEAVVAAVIRHGGDVLKLMGDGVLAIFPVTKADAVGEPCTAGTIGGRGSSSVACSDECPARP